jgi:hypothetical protein
MRVSGRVRRHNSGAAFAWVAGLVIAVTSLCPALAATTRASAKSPSAEVLAQAGQSRPALPATHASGPDRVIIGAYINDIQNIDFKSHSYSIDLYIWFRWRNPSINPSRSMEFMNRYASYDSLRTELYQAPEKEPDGSYYAILRVYEQFSRKFKLENYPFDRQTLDVEIEDSLYGTNQLVYVADGQGVTMNPAITLPGFAVGKPAMRIVRHHYPTFFGDISDPTATDYSRVILSVPVTRPAVAMTIKTFVPIVLVVICAALVFFVRPTYVEGRIGLGITALLTLVALQLAAASVLPDVNYLTLLDKVYILAYIFIILSIARIVATSWRGHEEVHEAAISRADRAWVTILIAAYCVGNAAIAYATLWRI